MVIKKYYLRVNQQNGIVRKCRLIANNIKRSLLITQETVNLIVSISSQENNGTINIEGNTYIITPNNSAIISVPKNKLLPFTITSSGVIEELTVDENATIENYDGSDTVKTGEIILTGNSYLTID